MIRHAVKLGLYGCGNRTRALLDSLYGEGEYEVVAAYDVAPEKVQAVCERYGGRACASAEELLGVAEAEAMMISLDPFAHPAAFHQALAARKPIFLEKPIAPTAAEAHAMLQAADAAGVPVHVGLAHRYTASFRGLRRYMAENDPGRIFAVSYRWFSHVETEIINMQNRWPDNFRLRISQIPFHCCHALDTMRLLGGEVSAVQARAIKWLDWEYVTPDEVMASFEFGSGALGSFHYSGVAYLAGHDCVVHAENYTATFTPWCEFAIYHHPPYLPERNDHSDDCRPNYEQNIGPDVHRFGRNSYNPLIMTDFLEAVRTGGPMQVPLVDGYKAAELAEAIEQSSASGERVALPLCFG